MNARVAPVDRSGLDEAAQALLAKRVGEEGRRIHRGALAAAPQDRLKQSRSWLQGGAKFAYIEARRGPADSEPHKWSALYGGHEATGEEVQDVLDVLLLGWLAPLTLRNREEHECASE
jgi:hypothetical protein